MAAGSSTTFTVQFSPTAGGTRNATVSFSEDDTTTTSPFTFAISGVGPAPIISVKGGGNAITDGATTASASDDTAFGSTTLGSPISETYTIANSGNAALTLGQVSIGGTNSSDFTVTSQPSASVAAGSSTTFTVQFSPTAGGTRNATVSFTENDTATTSPFTFAINGVGPSPIIAVTGAGQSVGDGSTTASAANDTSFGSTAVGSPISETYTIANSGNAALTLGQVSIGGSNASDFTVTSQPGTSVAAGSSTTFTVQFSPTAVGTRTATVSFSEDDSSATSPFTFAISGVTAAPSIAVKGGGNAITDGSTTASTTNDTAFGSMTLGGTALSETYTITNSGTAALTLGQVSITGTNASDFTVTSQPSSSVAAGGSTTFTIKYSPAAVGTSNATVSFTENDTTTTSPFTFAISGVANNNTASLSGTAYDDMLGTGSLASSDPVLANIKITLTGTDSSSTAVNQTATTSTSGTYTFSNLVAGTYTLTATLPTYLERRQRHRRQRGRNAVGRVDWLDHAAGRSRGDRLQLQHGGADDGVPQRQSVPGFEPGGLATGESGADRFSDRRSIGHREFGDAGDFVHRRRRDRLQFAVDRQRRFVQHHARPDRQYRLRWQRCRSNGHGDASLGPDRHGNDHDDGDRSVRRRQRRRVYALGDGAIEQLGRLLGRRAE